MMDPAKLAKQTISFYKKAFDSSFEALDMLQVQTERMLKMQMDMMTGMPEESKKFVGEWMKAYKKGCDEFKSAVEEKFKQVETMFAEAGKAEKK